MDLLCLDSRELGRRGALIVRVWKRQNVSKDQHLKAKRKCLSAAATEWSVRGGSDAWNKFEDITHECFSYQCGATCTATDKFFFFWENGVGFHLKEFRTPLASMGSWDQAMSQQITEKEKEYMHHGPFEDVSQIGTRGNFKLLLLRGCSRRYELQVLPILIVLDLGRGMPWHLLSSRQWQHPWAGRLWNSGGMVGCWDRSP